MNQITVWYNEQKKFEKSANQMIYNKLIHRY